MKREIGALSLLLALLLTAGWSVRRTDFLTGQIDLSLIRSERALKRGEEKAAQAALDNALSIWEDASVYTGMFLRHPDADSVSDAFFELRQLLLQGDAEAAPASYARLRFHLDTLDRMEHLSFGTVF